MLQFLVVFSLPVGLFHAPNNVLVFGPVTEQGVLPSRVKILNIRQRCCPTAPVSLAGLELLEFSRQQFDTNILQTTQKYRMWHFIADF